MMLKVKANLEKIQNRTEERLNTVKNAVQRKWDEERNKRKKDGGEGGGEDVQMLEGPDDILEGWTMLGGARTKTTVLDPESLMDNPPPSQNDQPAVSSTDSTTSTTSTTSLILEPMDYVPISRAQEEDAQSAYDSDEDSSPASILSKVVSSSIISQPQQRSDLSEETVGKFSLLSSAIIWNILSLLEAFDLCQLSRTSKQFFKLSTNEFLWERLYLKNFRKSNLNVDKALWSEQLRYGGYRSLYGTKLCEEQLNRTLRSLQNTDHNAVEWICKPLVSVSNFFSSPYVKILMFGLDGAGKTSMLYKLVGQDKVRTEQTAGFNTENIDHKGYTFDLWDLERKPANHDTFEFWKTYFKGAKGIIFVVDGTAPEKLPQAKALLDTFMADPALSQLPLSVFVNKRDVMDSMTPLQVLVGLNLHYLCNLSGWHIQPCSAVAPDFSLAEGLDWFCETFQQKEVQRLKTKIVS